MKFKNKEIRYSEALQVIFDAICKDRQDNNDCRLANITFRWEEEGDSNVNWLGGEVYALALYYTIGGAGHHSTTIHTGLTISGFDDTMFVDKLDNLISLCK